MSPLGVKRFNLNPPMIRWSRQSLSLLQFIQSRIPQGERSDTLCWRLKGDGKFDPRSYYHAIRATPDSLFPWKDVLKPKVPKRVDFFLWIATRDQILTLDNLMLRGHPLANRCCMYCCDRESVDHFLLHCPVTHTLWTFMLQAFGINWVMPRSVAGLLFCWHQNEASMINSIKSYTTSTKSSDQSQLQKCIYMTSHKLITQLRSFSFGFCINHEI